ncbi:hypothetical protein [Amycolatopsis alkalitolerans]|uniref:MarR family transcriptional regulator n=1 Tax=Amycolatopsis alkalitolerans TaxID=2547244 RepID=A0A5C4LQV7_9PSEU|nr:hypothetical protein [Amycolatopsis alkalitolerans]TNC20977.1 hypothetical protein FG385_29450 [Amycolatopsis alkalitolerans]
MASDAKLDPILAQLVRYPAALDVLDLLAAGPCTPAGLRTRLRAKRRAVDAALRVLAAYGLVGRCGRAGTWDEPVSACYELTGRGHDLAHRLERFDTLVAIYELLLYGEQLSG